MQDNNDIFDARLRDMLQDAEEKAPRGVWRGVRAQLDAAASWWKWASVGLVAACMLGGALWLGNVSDRSGDIASSPLVAETLPAVEEVTIPSAESVAEDVLVSEQLRAVPTRRKVSAPAGNLTSEVLDLESEAAEPVCEVKETAPEAQAPAKESVRKESGRSGAYSDPFAEMEREDRLAAARKASRRVALSLEGAAGGNDSDFSTNLGHFQSMADGADKTRHSSITETSASSYDIPISFGLGARFYVAPRLSLGTGLSFSMLERQFDGTYGSEQIISGVIQHSMYYLGVPLNLYFEPVQSSFMKFYVFGGGSAEYCVSNRYFVPGIERIKEKVNGLQYSVNAGLGVEFKLTEHMGIFFDPSARYFFHSDHPKSIRTDKPFMVNFEAGLRFNL